MTTRLLDLIAVYDDHETAEAIADDLEALGLTIEHPRIDEPDDQVLSLEAEMREEVEHALIAPTAVLIFTKEMNKGIAASVPVAALIGAVLALPLTLIAIDGWEWWERALLVCAIGSVGGGTIGFIVGAAMAARGPDDPSAAQRGTTVRVRTTRPEALEAMVRGRPIRIDLRSPDTGLLETIVTEEQYDDDGIWERLREQFGQPTDGEWHTGADEVRRLRAAEGPDDPGAA